MIKEIKSKIQQALIEYRVWRLKRDWPTWSPAVRAFVEAEELRIRGLVPKFVPYTVKIRWRGKDALFCAYRPGLVRPVDNNIPFFKVDLPEAWSLIHAAPPEAFVYDVKTQAR